MTLASLALISAARADADGPFLQEDVRSRCHDALTGALDDESPWVRVHAAEALIAVKRPERALATFRPKADTAEPRYRIVVWRVLAAAEPEPVRRRHYVERIRKALLDPDGPDQTHAMEALAKLREPPADDVERRCVREVADGEGPASPFALWRLLQGGDTGAVERLVKLLHAHDATTRARAAYVLGRLQPAPAEARDALAAALTKEPRDSPARPMLRAAMGADALRALAQDALGPAAGRYFAAMALAETGTERDYALLTQLLDDADADVRVGAAYALLQIDARGVTTDPTTRPA